MNRAGWKEVISYQLSVRIMNYEVRKIEDIFWFRSPLNPPLIRGASDSF
jgi:hypothetical protein